MKILVFALMMATMAMMVHPSPLSTPAPTPNPNEKKLLRDIKHKANDMEKHVPLDKLVTTTPRHDRICVDEFFCWAEKILKQLKSDLPEKQSLNKLTRSLNMLNTEFRNISCPLDTNIKYRLGSFLEDIKECVDHALWK